MELLLWDVKGYKGINLTKEKIKKYSFEEVEKKDDNIVKDIEKSLENGGTVFCLTKNKTIKMVYLFALTKKGKEKILIFDKKIVTTEVKKCTEEFEKDINEVLSKVLFDRPNITKAIWKEKELTSKKRMKSSLSTIKVISWIIIVISCMLALSMIVCSAFYSLSCITANSMEQIQQDVEVIDYVSSLNNYSSIDLNNTLAVHEEQKTFAIVEIVLPTIFKLIGVSLLVVSLKKLIGLVKDITDNKTLFTQANNKLLKKLALMFFISLYFIVNNLLIWLAISVVIEIIVYLFNYSVAITNEK